MEPMQHLFFACPFASYIWTLCKLKLKMNTPVLSLSEEAVELTVSFKRKSRASFIAIACFASLLCRCNLAYLVGKKQKDFSNTRDAQSTHIQKFV